MRSQKRFDDVRLTYELRISYKNVVAFKFDCRTHQEPQTVRKKLHEHSTNG